MGEGRLEGEVAITQHHGGWLLKSALKIQAQRGNEAIAPSEGLEISEHEFISAPEVAPFPAGLNDFVSALMREARPVDAHHIEHWADGGESTLENLVLLCRAPHAQLHQGSFTIRVESSAPAVNTGLVLSFWHVAGRCSDLELPNLQVHPRDEFAFRVVTAMFPIFRVLCSLRQ